MRDEVLELCGEFHGAVEDYPFGDEVAVFKVGGKMFALVMLEGEPGRVNLKCDPDLAIELRARFPAVIPGYHTNKRHWNTVELDGSIDDDELREMIDHSYDLVLRKLPRRAGRASSAAVMRASGVDASDQGVPPRLVHAHRVPAGALRHHRRELPPSRTASGDALRLRHLPQGPDRRDAMMSRWMSGRWRSSAIASCGSS